MYKKLLGVLAAGLLWSMGGVNANASIVDYSGSVGVWQTFSYSAIDPFYIDLTITKEGSGSSQLQVDLCSLVGLTLWTSLSESCGAGETRHAVDLSGIANEIIFDVIDGAGSVSLDWQFASWDENDQAAYAFGCEGGQCPAGYLEPTNFRQECPPTAACNVPEPSSLALMAIGLMGAGVVVRRRVGN